jgi:hypothetical protein
MKPIRMTLKQLKHFDAIARVDIRNKGGDVIPAGTRCAILDKYRGIALRAYGMKKESGLGIFVSGVGFDDIELVPKEPERDSHADRH